jgi:hypothetical protein
MGEKMEGGENDVSLFPSKNNQIWKIPRAIRLGTFHWPPNWGLLLPPSFSFSLKVRIWINYLSPFRHDICLNICKTILITFMGRRKMIIPSRWWKEGK